MIILHNFVYTCFNNLLLTNNFLSTFRHASLSGANTVRWPLGSSSISAIPAIFTYLTNKLQKSNDG